jgi:hypothetical protein
MRPLVTLALLLPSCTFLDSADDEQAADPAPPVVIPPPDRDAWEFDDVFYVLGVEDRLAAGTSIWFAKGGAAEVRLVSSDPRIVEAELLDHGLVVTAHQPGRASVIAESVDGSRVLAELAFTVVEVDAIEFHFRTSPVSPEPIDRLAALPDTTDSLRVVYRDASGEALAGLGSFTVRGSAVQIIDQAQVEGRFSEGYEPGAPLPLRFASAGQGDVSAELSDGRSFSVQIEVVAAPAEIDVVTGVVRDGTLIATEQVEVGEPVGADVVGRTADGRFVAGVIASWNTGTPVDFWFGSSPGSEIIFSIEASTTIDVTATAQTPGGTLTATRQVTAR